MLPQPVIYIYFLFQQLVVPNKSDISGTFSHLVENLLQQNYIIHDCYYVYTSVADPGEGRPHPPPPPPPYLGKKEITKERKAVRASEIKPPRPPISSRSGSATIPASLDSFLVQDLFWGLHQGRLPLLGVFNTGQLMSRGFPVHWTEVRPEQPYPRDGGRVQIIAFLPKNWPFLL